MNHPQQQQQQQHLQPPSNSNIPIEDEEGYQTPTSMPSSSQRSYNSSSHRPNSNRSLSSAASSVLQNNASFFVSHNTTMSRQRDVVNNGGAMIINTNQNNNNNNNNATLHRRQPSSPQRQSTHRRLEQSIDFLQDEKHTMTYSRRIALFLSRRYKWYNPRLNNVYTKSSDKDDYDADGGDREEPTVEDRSFEQQQQQQKHDNSEPSIEVAWAYYEHMTLPRRLVAEDPIQLLSNNQHTQKNQSTTSPPAIPTEMPSNDQSIINRVVQNIATNHKRTMTVAVPNCWWRLLLLLSIGYDRKLSIV